VKLLSPFYYIIHKNNKVVFHHRAAVLHQILRLINELANPYIIRSHAIILNPVSLTLVEFGDNF